jgi:hypothetical protein
MEAMNPGKKCFLYNIKMKRACTACAKEHETTFGGVMTIKKTDYIHMKIKML